MKARRESEERELVDISWFITALAAYRVAPDTKTRRVEIQRILTIVDWYVHSRVILEIKSTISSKELIGGLRSGISKNKLVKELLLFYRNKFYVLPVNLIWSKKIFEIIKNEKGFQ